MRTLETGKLSVQGGLTYKNVLVLRLIDTHVMCGELYGNMTNFIRDHLDLFWMDVWGPGKILDEKVPAIVAGSLALFSDSLLFLFGG